MLDATDRQIVDLLQEDARLPNAEIARRIGMAPSATLDRVRKLEERGVIRGYGPDVDPARMGYPVTAFVFLQITQGRLTEATAVLKGVPEVLEATAVSGPSDLLCRVVARDTEHLQEIVNRVLSNRAIRRSTSYIALSQPISYRTGPLVSAAPRGR
jgi:DNA-binding Lrp family transcriptional regulator